MFAVVRAARFSICSSKFVQKIKINESFRLKNNYQCFLYCDFYTNNGLMKKRRSDEEKNSQKIARRLIKISPKNQNPIIGIWQNMTVLEVAKALNKDVDHVYEVLDHIKDTEKYTDKNSIIDNPQVIKNIIKLSGYRFKFVAKPQIETEEKEIFKDAVRRPPALAENLRSRPPVVTVMGHVDHGKTTLLDSLRKTNVVDQEFGGITQHIGAFSVKLSNGDLVTFLDTPGHAAFSAMRARGANVTDMVVLVVAADDGVMEQTVESIRMAREAKVPIIVAINKIDKPQADIKATKNMLAQQGIIVEDLGGDVQAIPISALKQINLEVLVEAINVQSQLMNLQADPTGLMEGVVIESQTDPKRGKLATVIVQRGTLKRGSVIVAGLSWARVRIMFSSEGLPVSEALPSTPVQVLGWRELPSAGDEILEVPSEKRAAEIVKWRSKEKLEQKAQLDSKAIAEKEAEHRLEYEKLLHKKRMMGYYKVKPTGPRQKMITESDEPALNVIVKGDVDGSVEAILDVLVTYNRHEQCKLDIIHYGVGNVSETDIELAETFNGIIYAFNVFYSPEILELSKTKNVEIKKHNIIYKLIDDIKSEINLRIPMAKEEELLGEANVLQNFSIDEKRKTANVAGCRCTKGVLKKKALYRVVRGESVIYDGKLESMRHLKEEVDTIKKEMECGIRMEDGSIEFKPGDTIVCYELVDVKRVTDWNPGF